MVVSATYEERMFDIHNLGHYVEVLKNDFRSPRTLTEEMTTGIDENNKYLIVEPIDTYAL